MKTSFYKKALTYLSFIIASSSLQAQQWPLFSQYMNNDFVLNPAIAGTKDYNPIRAVIRSQWVGIEGQPNTQTLSYHSKLGERKVALGGYVFNDKIGPISKIGASATYAYHLDFANETKLSFGLSALLYRYQLNTSELHFDNDGNSDKVILTNNFKSFYPNFSFGVYYYGEKFYGGFSIPELFQTKITSTSDFFILKQRRHYFLHGGYKWKIDDTYVLEPSVLIKYVSGAPVEVDINAQLHAFDKFSLGISYRTNDALVFLIGFRFKEHYRIGYSYDVTMSAIKKYSKGSHEIMLGYDLFQKGKTSAKFY